VISSIKTFRDLIAWQKSKALAKRIYMITGQMPASERFGLTLQMRRAAVSIPSNIAEGYARQATADYLRHLRIARGSLAELDTQVGLAIELEMMKRDRELDELLLEEDRILQGLIRSIQRQTSSKQL
jgi:four helix bundle protein